MPPEPLSGAAPQAEAEIPARGSVGALLKASRSRLGIDLAVIADTLRIRLVYLEAIEAGRYEDLPGGTYAVGFIRSYGDQLGLDGMELVRRFKLETGASPAAPAAAPPISFPRPVKTLGLPVGAIATGVVVVVALLVGAWLLFSSDDRAALIPKIPAALNEKVGAPEPVLPRDAVAPAPEEAKPEPAPVEPAKVEPPKPEPVKPAVEAAKPVEPPKPAAKVEPPKPEPAKPAVEAAKPVEPPKPAAKAEPPKPAAEEAEGLPEGPETVARGPRVYGQENADARVEIVAAGDSWVQVTENGSLVLTRLLHAGDRFKVPNRGGLLLMTGNAGGLEVLVDGQKIGPVGAPGQVMRDVSLDAERLRSARKTSN